MSNAFDFPCIYPQLAVVDVGWSDNGYVALFELADGTPLTLPIDEATCNTLRALIAQRQEI